MSTYILVNNHGQYIARDYIGTYTKRDTIKTLKMTLKGRLKATGALILDTLTLEDVQRYTDVKTDGFKPVLYNTKKERILKNAL